MLTELKPTTEEKESNCNEAQTGMLQKFHPEKQTVKTQIHIIIIFIRNLDSRISQRIKK